MRALRAALVALLFAGSAHAATFWVRPAATGTGSGADSSNAMTLATANATVVPGSVVRILSGTYTDPIQPRTNGTSGSRIYYYGWQNGPNLVTVAGVYFGGTSTGTNASWGDYVTVKWVTTTGDIAQDTHLRSGNFYGCHDDSVVRVLAPSGTVDLLMNGSGQFVADSLTITGSGQIQMEPHVNTYPSFGWVSKNNRITNSTFTLTRTGAGSTNQFFIEMKTPKYCAVLNNTFNFTSTNSNAGYLAFTHVYLGKYNNFNDNTFNIVDNSTTLGTKIVFSLRDSSYFNQVFRNTWNVSGAPGRNPTFLASNSGSEYGAGGQTGNNHFNGNVINNGIAASGGVYFQYGARTDTFQFNRVAVNTAVPALIFPKGATVTNSIFRHNTFYSAGGGTVAAFDSTATMSGTRLVSNIFYSAVTNGSGAAATISMPLLVGTPAVDMDSLGLVFNRSGTAGNAIRLGTTSGAPASGAGFGSSGKAIWNTPTFTDSAYATLNATLLGGSPATTATLQDGYAGAYGTASADVTAPSAISDLAAGTATSTTIPLTWTSQGDDAGVGTASSYELRYSTGVINAGNFSSATQFTTGVPVPQVAGTVQGVTVTGLTPGTSYQFAIKSKDEANNQSAISNVPGQSTAAAVDVTPPAAVTDLSANAASVSSVALLWTAPGDDGSVGTATTYDIRRNTTDITAANWSASTQLTNEAAPRVAGLLEILIDSGLSQGVVYYYAMKTRDEEGNESALSNVVAGETMPDETPPSAVSALTGYSPTTTTAALVWESSGDDGISGSVSSYILKRSTSPIDADNFDAATTVDLGEYRVQVEAGEREDFSVTGLSPATTNYFAVKACDEVPNCSDISNVISVTTGSDIDATAPSAVSTLASNAVTTNSVDLTWTAPGDDAGTGTATTNDLRYSLALIDAGNFASAIQVVDEPAPAPAGQLQAYTVTGLASNTTYYFAIKVADEVGNTSAISNVLTKATAADATLPGTVTNLTVLSVGSGTVTLRWTAPGDDADTGTATSYDIRYRTGGAVDAGNWAAATQATGEPTPSAAGSIETFLVTGLVNGTTYYFGIRAKDEATNEGSYSNSPSGTPTSTQVVSARARRFRAIRR